MPSPQRVRFRRAPRPRPTAPAAALLVAVAAAGCSTGDDTGAASAADPTPSSSPSPSASPPPVFDAVEDLETYCRSRSDEDIDDGYPAAAEYTGPGPHPTVVFRRLPTTDAHVTGYRMADHSPYDDWLPDSPEQAVLLVCVHAGAPSPESVDTCEYEPSSVTGISLGEAFELPLHEQTYKFTAYALRTGEEVAAGEIPSADLSCPDSVFSNSMVREAGKAYTTIDYGAVFREVEELVTADAP